MLIVGVVLSHISVNLFNEYSDFQTKIDFHTNRTPFSGGSGTLVMQPRLATQALVLAMASLAITIACGLFLIGAEIFVPGGILGTIGAAALVAAAIIGFNVFPPVFGWLSLLLIILLTGLAVFVWMRYFPKSPIGKALSLAQSLGSKDQAAKPRWTAGMKGTALSALRPAGKALIDGRRTDVIAGNGTWIEQNATIEVMKVEGNRIYVKETHVEG
jgi:membrane-bound ClpP family serine protease